MSPPHPMRPDPGFSGSGSQETDRPGRHDLPTDTTAACEGQPLMTTARANPAIDQHCVLCGKYGTRSPDHGKTWWCPAHDFRGEKDVAPIRQQQRAASGPSWDPCQSCNGKGCPWCQHERYGLLPRKPISTARMGTTRENDR